MFLAGEAVDPTRQGKAGAFHDLETLLTGPIENLQETLKEPKA